MGWPIWVSIIVTAAVVGIYTVSGELSATVVTDAVQMVTVFVGGITIIVLGLWGVGGWGGLIGKIYSRWSHQLSYDRRGRKIFAKERKAVWR